MRKRGMVTGKTHKFKSNGVVICAGYLPDLTLAKALKGKEKTRIT